MDFATTRRRLESSDVEQRRAAAGEAARSGNQAAELSVELVRASGDVDDQVAEWAAAALEGCGPPSRSHIDPLTELLGDARTGYWAATLLGRLETDAAPAVEALVAVFERTSEIQVRQRIAWAFSKIGPAAALAEGVLLSAARSENERLARQAQMALDAIRSGQ